MAKPRDPASPAGSDTTEPARAADSTGSAAVMPDPTPAPTSGAETAAPPAPAPQPAPGATPTAPAAVVRPWETGQSPPPPPSTEGTPPASTAPGGEQGEAMEAVVHVELGTQDLDGNGPSFAPGAPMRVTAADAKALAAARAAKPIGPRK